MSSEIFGHQLPAEVVREDRRLEGAAESASEALAKHRWHWTLDESNEARVSFGAYAQQVGRNRTTIAKSANGYVRFTQSGGGAAATISEAVEAAHKSAEKNVATQAVAEANDVTPQTARRWHGEVVREVRHAVEKKVEKHEQEGQEFTLDDQAEYALKVAETKKRLRDHEQREQERYKASHSWQFMDAIARVGKARQQLRSALKIIRDTEFTDDEKEVIEQTNIDTRALSSMITAALTGDSGVDWDKELAVLDGRAHDGE